MAKVKVKITIDVDLKIDENQSLYEYMSDIDLVEANRGPDLFARKVKIIDWEIVE